MTIERLNPIDTPLEGLSLIEASAGTGKTFTITALYIRLLLELGLQVENILVVTYTKAATAELKTRIRSRLVEVQQAFRQGSSEDEFCQGLLDRYPETETVLKRLRRGILCFDQAAIFTIHGFCQRVLAESAFESGMPFQTELLGEPGELLQEIVDDFWRSHIQDVSVGQADYLLAQGITPEGLLWELRKGLGKPYLEVRAAKEVQNLEALELAFFDCLENAGQIWRQSGEEIRQLLSESKALNGNKYRKASLDSWFEQMERYLEGQPGPWFEKFSKFTASTLKESVKKGKSPPEHAFFPVCEALMASRQALQAAYANNLIVLKQKLLDYCDRQLQQRKARRRVQSYDDLLLNLLAALKGEGGGKLAESVKQNYQAALIDEFQDTDPIQYEIFSLIYGRRGAPVFMVGDPKQAIYSFRGADIFAYLEAREDSDRRYTLDLNWRSDPALVEAVNALFDQPHDSFFYDQIPFHPSAAALAGPSVLNEQQGASEPFRIWLMEGTEKPLTRAEAEQQSVSATVAEIARLLKGGEERQINVGDHGLSGGDIAVLVRSHRQGQMVQQQLSVLGISSVQRSPQNLFDSHEAMELDRLLIAIAEPTRQALVTAALATDMLGFNGDALYELKQDEHALARQLERFRELHQLWRSHGFIRMFWHLMANYQVAPRLVSLGDGERRLTNLMHLGELLHQHECDSQQGMGRLIKWLGIQRSGEVPLGEEGELRLETDEALVQIVTIHKSKGLQYPIVFCPFLWADSLSSKKEDSFSFHDPEAHFQPVLELGSDSMESCRDLALQEELAENLRLLYVALTRARHRCYITWGNVREVGQSALAWLLHPGDSLEQVIDRVSQLGNAGMRARLDELVARAPQSIQVQPILLEEQIGAVQSEGATATGVLAQFERHLSRSGGITSFTALTSGQVVDDLPDYDEAGVNEGNVPLEEEGEDIFAFPRGAKAGQCLHAIFEQLDFSHCQRSLLESLVRENLQHFDFDTGWGSVVADMVQRVLATPLDVAGGLRLSSVVRENCLVEMAFYYPLASLHAADLRELLLKKFASEESMRRAVERLDFEAVEGFMKGYIDLIFEAGGKFYLVDYKSNWLGPEIEAYGQARLTDVMAHENYYLQYLFYTLALHRYLDIRLPDYDYERHFGGVFYLFLRGMDPEIGPAYGVYRDRPGKELIQAMERCVCGDGS